jgi:hypothetical protein
VAYNAPFSKGPAFAKVKLQIFPSNFSEEEGKHDTTALLQVFRPSSDKKPVLTTKLLYFF